MLYNIKRWKSNILKYNLLTNQFIDHETNSYRTHRYCRQKSGRSYSILWNVLGLKCYAVEEVKDQKVKTAFFQVGQTKIELLESTDPEGPIGKFVEKNGGGMHHMAFAVKM